MDGLTKWGGSELVVRAASSRAACRRRRATAIPAPDQTWAGDIRHFEAARRRRGQTSRDNDLWLSRTIHAAAAARLEGEP